MVEAMALALRREGLRHDTAARPPMPLLHHSLHAGPAGQGSTCTYPCATPAMPPIRVVALLALAASYAAAAPPPKDAPLAIVGGGVSGLFLASLLADAGYADIRIFEAADRIVSRGRPAPTHIGGPPAGPPCSQPHSTWRPPTRCPRARVAWPLAGPHLMHGHGGGRPLRLQHRRHLPQCAQLHNAGAPEGRGREGAGMPCHAPPRPAPRIFCQGVVPACPAELDGQGECDLGACDVQPALL